MLGTEIGRSVHVHTLPKQTKNKTVRYGVVYIFIGFHPASNNFCKIRQYT